MAASLSVLVNDSFFEEAWTQRLRGHPLRGIGLVPDGVRAVVQAGQRIDVIDLALRDGHERRRFSLPVTRSGPVVVGGEGQLVAIGFRGRELGGDRNLSLHFFSREGREIEATGLPASIRSHVFTEESFVSAHTDDALRAWSCDGELRWTFRPPGGHDYGIKVVAASVGRILCASHRAAHMLDSDGRVLWSFEPPDRRRSDDPFSPYLDDSGDFAEAARESERLLDRLRMQLREEDPEGESRDAEAQPPGKPEHAEFRHLIGEGERHLRELASERKLGVCDVAVGLGAAWIASTVDLWRLDLHGRVVAAEMLGPDSDQWSLVTDHRGDPVAAMGWSHLAMLESGRVTSLSALGKPHHWGKHALEDALVLVDPSELVAIDRASRERFRARTEKRIVPHHSIVTRDLVALAIGGELVALRRPSAH